MLHGYVHSRDTRRTCVWGSFIDSFDKGEMRRFIVVIYNSEVYTRT